MFESALTASQLSPGMQFTGFGEMKMMRPSRLKISAYALLLAACLLAAPALGQDSDSPAVGQEEAAAEAASAPPPPPPSPPSSKPRTASPASFITWEKGLARLNKMELKVADVDVVDQGRHLVKTIPSMAAFLTLNHVLKYIMRTQLGITTFPHTLTGMMGLFGALSYSEEEHAKKVVDFMEPATTLLTNFLPCFFIPALIVAPLATRGISNSDIGKFLAIISIGLPSLLAFTGHLVQGLQAATGTGTPKSNKKKSNKSKKAAKYTSWFSPSLEKMFAAGTLGLGALSLKIPGLKHAFYVSTTFLAFIFGSRIPRHFPPAIRSFWHPLMSTYTVASAVFLVFAKVAGVPFFDLLQEYFVGGGSPFTAAGNFIMFWLEPSIISFAFGLYARRKLLFANFIPIMAGTFISTLAGIFTMATLNKFLDPPHDLKMALLPRATAALAVVQAATIGASTSLTTVNCVITGIMGANFAPKLNDLFFISDPLARGLSTGCSGLALASAALVSADPSAFPFGALGMALTSTWATILYSIPAFTEVIKDIIGRPSAPVKNAKVPILRMDSGKFTGVLKSIAKFGGG